MRKSIQPDKVLNIASQFPDLNTGWLLTGEGEMLKTNTPTEQVDSYKDRYFELLERHTILQEKYTTLLEECQKKDALLQGAAARTAGR